MLLTPSKFFVPEINGGYIPVMCFLLCFKIISPNHGGWDSIANNINKINLLRIAKAVGKIDVVLDLSPQDRALETVSDHFARPGGECRQNQCQTQERECFSHDF
jgi:hypothetical protein